MLRTSWEASPDMPTGWLLAASFALDWAEFKFGCCPVGLCMSLQMQIGLLLCRPMTC